MRHWTRFVAWLPWLGRSIGSSRKTDRSTRVERVCRKAALGADERSCLDQRGGYLAHTRHQWPPVLGESPCGFRRAEGCSCAPTFGEIEQLCADGFFGNHRRLPRRQASLQNFTCSQSRSHFFRQVNGRPHAAQVFTGRCSLRTPRMPHECFSMQIITSLRRIGIGVHGGS